MLISTTYFTSTKHLAKNLQQIIVLSKPISARISATSTRRRLYSSSSTTTLLPKKIKIVEVGPRDGLQNEITPVPVQSKINLIHNLKHAGCQHIEATSFVSPKWVPQMADAGRVMEGVRHLTSTSYDNNTTILSCLTPNLIGVRRALLAGANEVTVFASASETFSSKNINCTIDESFIRFQDVIDEASRHNVPVRGYVSCALGCPYEGHVSFDAVQKVSSKLINMGCYEVSLCDTIGCGTPDKVIKLLNQVKSAIGMEHIAIHFHDTYGQALVNTYAAICEGVTTVDSSIGGLGGCPFVKKSHEEETTNVNNDFTTTTTTPSLSGNLATEDLVYMLHDMGIETGLNLELLCEASNQIFDELDQTTRSKVGKVMSMTMEEQELEEEEQF